jgi:aryl sulfotransferase
VTAQTVWIASYPKAGSTWLRAVLTAWRTGGPIDLNELDGGPMPATRAPIDEALGIPSSSMTADEVELVRPRVDEVMIAGAEAPRLRKIHDAYFPGPAGEPIVSVAATRAAVYVIRDPRDVAVSYAHHRGMPLEWAQRHLDDPGAAMSGDDDRLGPQVRQRLGTWSQHVRSWVDEAPFPVEVVRYEDFAETPVSTFARALRFAGLEDVDEARIADAVEHAAFNRLRRAEKRHGFTEQPPGADDFFRRGEAGSWREELPAELGALIEASHRDVMARFGYL